MPGYDFSVVKKFIEQFSQFDIDAVLGRPDANATATKLERLQRLAKNMPLCAEQLLRILEQLLSLHTEHNINQIHLKNKNLKPFQIDVPTLQAFISAISACFDNELNHALASLFQNHFVQYNSQLNAKVLHEAIQPLVYQHIASIDISYVMQAAKTASKLTTTQGKNAFVVIGKTGVGKSFIINWIGGATLKRDHLKNITNLKKQPSYLQHIKIGDMTTSETAHMGVVSIDNNQKKEIKKFHDEEIVICDAPGYGDTAAESGSKEIPLANSLETIIPLQKTKTVRFLVLFSADNFGEKSESILETLKSVAGLFVSEEELRNNLNAITFALCRESAKNKKPEFQNRIQGLIDSRRQRPYNDKVALLLKTIQQQLKSENSLVTNIPIIRPETKTGIKVPALLDLMWKKQAIESPKKVLTSFIEPTIKDATDNQLKIHMAAIDRMLDVLGNVDQTLDNEAMQALIQLLASKYAELSFMDAAFSVDDSCITTYFSKFSDLLERLKKNATAILCPQEDSIDQMQVDKAISIVNRLRSLDALVTTLIDKTFADNRQRVSLFVRSFNKEMELPKKLDSLTLEQWKKWISDNRPALFSESVHTAIKNHRLKLIARLNGLRELQQLEFETALAVRAARVPVLEQQPSSTNIVKLMDTDEVVENQTKVILQTLEKHQDLNKKDEAISNLTNALENKKEQFCPKRDSVEELKVVYADLSLQETYFNNLFTENNDSNKQIHASSANPYRPNMCEEYQQELLKQLDDVFNSLKATQDFVVMAQIIERKRNILVDVFSCSPEINNLEELFVSDFRFYINSVISQMNQLPPVDWDEETTKTFIYSINMIYAVTQQKVFEKICSSENLVQENQQSSNLYPVLQQSLQDNLTQLDDCLLTRFNTYADQIISAAKTNNELTSFVNIQQPLQQLWYLLSIPCEQHKHFAENYKNVVTKVSDYCKALSGQLIGQLQSQNLVDKQIHIDTNYYLMQLTNAPWVPVLGLVETVYDPLKNAVEKRANYLIEESKKVNLQLGWHKSLNQHHWIVEEMQLIKETFNSDQLSATVLTNLTEAIQNYQQQIMDTLLSIMTQAENKAREVNVLDRLPLEFLQNGLAYIRVCEDHSLFQEQSKTTFNALMNFVQQYTAQKQLDVTVAINNLQPETGEQDFNAATEKITNHVQDYTALKEDELLNFYEQSVVAEKTKPLVQWAHELSNLASVYQNALTQALARATQGITSAHEGIMARCMQLSEAFDGTIKHCSNETKLLTFRKVHKTFTTAFKQEHVSKLKGVMSQVFAGNFEQARALTVEEKTFAQGTELRATLNDQIGVFIETSIKNIKSFTNALKQQTVSPVGYKQAAMNYQCLKKADFLVSAGLLPQEQLQERELLLTQSQTNVDEWYQRVLDLIQNALTEYDFNSVILNYDALKITLVDIQPQPTNMDLLQSQLESEIQQTIDSVAQWFDKPVDQWASNPICLADLQKRYLAAEKQSFDNQPFSTRWKVLVEKISSTFNKYVDNIEQQLKTNVLDMQQAVDAMQKCFNLFKGMPKSNLYSRLESRCNLAFGVFDNIASNQKKEVDRYNSIQILIDANASITNSRTLIEQKNNNLYQAIKPKIQKNEIPFEELVAFADLYDRFGSKFGFLKQKRTYYENTIANMVSSFTQKILHAVAEYKTSAQPAQAVTTIKDNLQCLVEIQQLSTETNAKAKLVDENLHNQLLKIFEELSPLLEANNKTFNEALKTRSVAQLQQTLAVAETFQAINQQVEKFIQAFSHPPETLVNLRSANKSSSYRSLLDQVIAAIVGMKEKLRGLDPKHLSQEGQGERQKFYESLKRDISFLQDLPTMEAHLQKKGLQQILTSEGIAKDYGLEECFTAVRKFIASTFRVADNQLKSTTDPTVQTEWNQFNLYYQELKVFVEQCQGATGFDNLKLPLSELSDKSQQTGTEINASVIVRYLQKRFDEYLTDLIKTYKTNYLQKKTGFGQYFVDFIYQNTKQLDNNNQEALRALASLLSSMQRMGDQMPQLAETVKGKISSFLNDIQQERDGEYINSLSRYLGDEEHKGYGNKLMAEQSIFRGLMIARRNQLTMQRGLEQMLKEMRVRDSVTSDIRHLNQTEKNTLKNYYDTFQNLYKEKIDHYTHPNQEFQTRKDHHLKAMAKDIQKLLESNPVEQDKNGKILWNEQAIKIIPQLSALIFATWTMYHSEGYFDASNTNQDKGRLMTPHPGQVNAIMHMLMTHTPEQDLESQFAQVLTGEGKSVVIALLASILALRGFNVNVACYSQYLTSRDYQDFEWMFKLLGIEKYVQYGTFNEFSEELLNQKGDLRQLFRNKVLGESNVIEVKPDTGRETVTITDEQDTVSTFLYGNLYQPHTKLKGEKIENLLDAVWKSHQQGALKSLDSILKMSEYKECIQAYPDHVYLFEHAIQAMVADLDKYKPEQGHDYYVTPKGELYYKLYDGTTTNQSRGYATYWACKSDGNISDECTNKHSGLIIPVGTYSYIDMLRDRKVRANFGVTGTLEQLHPQEVKMLNDLLSVKQSFHPSAYPNNDGIERKFKKGVDIEVVDDITNPGDFDLRLFSQIPIRLQGIYNKDKQRALLLFFQDDESLESFYHCDAFKGYKQKGAKKMTPTTVTNLKECNYYVGNAGTSGEITLAGCQYARGTDFTTYDETVLDEGGIHGFGLYWPKTAAEFYQLLGRVGRQGKSGSFSFILKMSDLIRDFGVTAEGIKEANDQGKLYEFLTKARQDKFDVEYEKLNQDQPIIQEKFHQPSMKLREKLIDQSAKQEDIIEAHQQTLPGAGKPIVVPVNTAKVMILFDSTGSMGDLLDALKNTLRKVVKDLKETLKEFEISEEAFKLKIAHYKDYMDGNDIYQGSEWTCDQEELNHFINAVSLGGGGANDSEAVECGLFQANKEVKNGLTQVILIGDEPPSRKKELNKWNSIRLGLVEEDEIPEHYKHEVKKLADAGVQVSPFFVETNAFFNRGYKKINKERIPLTQHKFNNIAKSTARKDEKDKAEAEAQKLDLTNHDVAARTIQTLFGKNVLKSVVQKQGRDDEFSEIYERFMKRTQQCSK